ncbi:hypothetical protein ABBQ38_012836 [Trebouxia sp. C0009 RCD-2024]
MAESEVASVPAEPSEIVRTPPRPRVKMLPKPDDSEVNAQTAKLNDEIQAQKKRIDEIRDIINNKQNGRQGRSGEQQALKNRLVELKTQFQGELNMKQQIRAELENATRARDALRAQLREMKGKLEYMTVDKIDDQLRRLEHRMAHSSQSLQEEKKTLEDMKRLKASRSTVAQYNGRFEKLSSDDEGRSAIVQRLQQADTQLNSIKAEEEKLRNQLGEIRSKEAEQKSDIPSLIQEREDCRAVINELYSTVKDIRADFRVKLDEYYERQREFKVQQQEEQRERRARQQQEWEERQAERKARQAEMAGEPFDKEVTLCEQLASYLTKFKPATQSTGAAASSADVVVPQGMQVLKKKDVENAYAGLEKKVKGKKGKGAARAAEGSGQPEDKKLLHSLDMLGAFATLKVEVPLTTSKVQETLGAIEGRKEYYLKKRQSIKDGTYDAEKDPEAHSKKSPSRENGATTSNGFTANGDISEEFEHVKHDEVTGPEAEAAIAQITQQPPDSPQEGSAPDSHASKPTTSALAEHDAAFPAIGAMNGLAGPGKSASAANGSASVVATVGDDAPGTLDSALETALSSVSVCLTVGDEGENVVVALTLDGIESGSPKGRGGMSAASLQPQAPPKMSYRGVL